MTWRMNLCLLLALVGLPSLAFGGNCESTAVCPETDVNCDNFTDGFDIAVVRNTANWLLDVEDAEEPRSDVNGDGFIDGFDIAAIRNTACFLQGGFTSTHLAGNSLEVYPFFEYVRAFNEDEPVEVAIDPTRFPAIVGKTCDIHIVEAKTVAEWAADPSLTDVTAGGAQTETFSGATIQANTFVVTGPFELDADAGIGLGVGYDMVLDCDQDGAFGNGDYIDGYGDEAGLYAIHDVSAQGPLAVTELPTYSVGTVFGIPSSRTSENTYYPTQIGDMGQLPMVVVSHGNGHQYTWYDHIGFHLASYGYVVMSHQNDTQPGIETASTTTLGHTDAFIDQLEDIGGGVLEGHVDSSRIIWIGHSRGAEGIARAYDRIFDGTHVPTHYTIEDITLLSSMLPTDFLKTFQSNPHDANYHLWTASGDADVDGSAGCDLCQTFHLHDRATDFRHSTIVQGTGHGDFHTASGSVFDGPCHIVPKDRVHDIMQGMFLPLVKYYAEGNIPAQEFFWRQYERFHPIGVPEGTDPCIVVSNTWHNGADVGNVVIDDYQTNPATELSSSGGTVSFTVEHLYEGRLDDNNSSFTWIASDPMNGMTHASASDNSTGVAFDWNGADLYYEQGIVDDLKDFTPYIYLSFRGAQVTQHPYTVAVLGDLTFTVTLRDGSGTTSSINFGAFGGGLEEPYQRSDGWHNEFETIRIRLTDFLNNGSGLDLSDIEAIRLNVGPSWGANEGRIGIDDIELTSDPMPE